MIYILVFVFSRNLSVAAAMCTKLPQLSCQIPSSGCMSCAVGCIPFDCVVRGNTTDLYQLTGSFGQDDCVLTEKSECEDCLECDSSCRKNIFKNDLCSFQFLSDSGDSESSGSTWSKYKYIIISVILIFVLLIVIGFAVIARRNKTEVVKKYHTSYAGLFSIDSKDRSIVGNKADAIIDTINALESSAPKAQPSLLVEKPTFEKLEIQQVPGQVHYEEGSVVESMAGSVHDGNSIIRNSITKNHDRGTNAHYW
eukprot:NODE_598_length_6262_cov_0.141652.p3 type:complete len:253 gc:universal NODE_598_length_6262_cov_0.141652:6015-5257(-)